MNKKYLKEVKLDNDELRWLYNFISDEKETEYHIIEEIEDNIIATFIIGKNRNGYYQTNIELKTVDI